MAPRNCKVSMMAGVTDVSWTTWLRKTVKLSGLGEKKSSAGLHVSSIQKQKDLLKDQQPHVFVRCLPTMESHFRHKILTWRVCQEPDHSTSTDGRRWGHLEVTPRARPSNNLQNCFRYQTKNWSLLFLENKRITGSWPSSLALQTSWSWLVVAWAQIWRGIGRNIVVQNSLMSHLIPCFVNTKTRVKATVRLFFPMKNYGSSRSHTHPPLLLRDLIRSPFARQSILLSSSTWDQARDQAGERNWWIHGKRNMYKQQTQ